MLTPNNRRLSHSDYEIPHFGYICFLTVADLCNNNNNKKAEI